MEEPKENLEDNHLLPFYDPKRPKVCPHATFLQMRVFLAYVDSKFPLIHVANSCISNECICFLLLKLNVSVVLKKNCRNTFRNCYFGALGQKIASMLLHPKSMLSFFVETTRGYHKLSKAFYFIKISSRYHMFGWVYRMIFYFVWDAFLPKKSHFHSAIPKGGGRGRGLSFRNFPKKRGVRIFPMKERGGRCFKKRGG